MEIYFVRHGLINYETFTLNENGLKFAKKLPELLPEKIDIIVSDIEKRCLDTVKYLCEKTNIKVRKFTKNELKNVNFIDDLETDGIVVVCYRIESVNDIFSSLDLPLFTEDNRDEAYEKIYLYDSSSLGKLTTLGTGFKKT